MSVYRTIGPTLVSVLSESTRNAEIRDAYAVNERENRQIVNKSVAIYNKKNPDQLLLIRVGRVFKLLTINGLLYDIKKT